MPFDLSWRSPAQAWQTSWNSGLPCAVQQLSDGVDVTSGEAPRTPQHCRANWPWGRAGASPCLSFLITKAGSYAHSFIPSMLM